MFQLHVPFFGSCVERTLINGLLVPDNDNASIIYTPRIAGGWGIRECSLDWGGEGGQVAFRSRPYKDKTHCSDAIQSLYLSIYSFIYLLV